MTEDNAARVIAMRQRLDAVKTKVIESKTEQKQAEDQLAAADDAVDRLGLNSERDLERQVTKLCQEADEDIGKLKTVVEDIDRILDK